MRKILAKIAGYLISFIGIVFCSIYVQHKISIISIILGLFGVIIIYPIFEHWTNYFESLFEKKDLESNSN
jgi:ABC-type phosphate transport system permease subunit